MSARICNNCGQESKEFRRQGMCRLCYRRARARQIAYGKWEPGYVDAGPTLRHYDALLSAGMTPPQIRRLSKVPGSTLRWITNPGNGARSVSKATEQGILSVPVPTATQLVASARGWESVPALGTRRRLQALVAAGWPPTVLARELNTHTPLVSRLLHHDERIRAFRHHQVVELFNRLQVSWGPSERARREAQEKRWPLPFQWDEDEIDEPDARPASGSRRRTRAVA